jgi:Uncharacterized protein conserved in bacteria (DUF2188)
MSRRYRVSRTSDGKWEVWGEGALTSGRVYETRIEALNAALELARAAAGGGGGCVVDCDRTT